MGFPLTSIVEVRWAGKAVPERAEADIWGMVPPVAGPVFGGGCCEGVVEGGGASIFMALDSWGCCELFSGFG